MVDTAVAEGPAGAPQAKTYTFEEWLKEQLLEVDPNVDVIGSSRGDILVRINGDWPVATVYGPPSGILGLWLDVHPRDLQVAIFEKIIVAIKMWYGIKHAQEMEELHGPSQGQKIIAAATELVESEWATTDMRYVPNELFKRLKEAVNGEG